MPIKAATLSHCNIPCASAKCMAGQWPTRVNVIEETAEAPGASKMERRLTAILAADVVGYSRLMGANEVGTLASLNHRRNEVIEPRIASSNGRIVKLTGDGILAEFPSVVDAVECALAVQREMKSRNVEIPEDRRIELRIGIHLGDVIVEDGDI